MMPRTGLAGATLMMLGCAPVPPPALEAQPVQGTASCEASKGQALVGRQRSGAVEAEALRITGARAVRWIGPDDAVTMDYREDRLNIHVDARGRVTRVRCG